MKGINLLMAWMVLCPLGSLAGRAVAASFTVQMTGGLSFSPASLSIAQGDTVIWTNVSAFIHTSTSGAPPTGDGLWDSSSTGAGSAFAVTFTNFAPRAYPYFCSFHYFLGMTGTLTITNAGGALPTLGSSAFINGQFRFTINGTAGITYVTEVSEDFSTWSAIHTNIAPADSFEFIDPSATNRLSFYRVRQGS
jgi:plastocyanin